MKKILSLILTAAMILSAVVMTAGAAETGIGFGEYIPNAPVIADDALTQVLDAEQKDAQGIYYTLDDLTMTAIVGNNTYADSASAGQPNTDSIIIPQAVTFDGKQYAVTAVGRNAFDGTAVREAYIACAAIGEFAFAGCTELEYVYTSATEIKGFAFWGCTALTEVFVYTADSIGGGAFWNCSNLKNVALTASTIMEKAFEGCDGIEYFVFDTDAAPAVAAGALGSSAKAYIREGASGYENFPLTTEVIPGMILDVEDVYAKAGETVSVIVNAPVAADGAIEITLALANGLSVESISDINLNDAVLNGDKITGTIAEKICGPVVILNIKVADNAAVGKYDITATADGYISMAGSVTICDHANTKTVTVKAASCDESGEENTVCTACGEVTSTEVVEAKGHTYKDFVINPTCTEIGYTRHICECCADSYTDAEVEANGHTWDEGNVIQEVSTTKPGIIDYTCVDCGTTNRVNIPKIKYGDANCDGSIDLADVTLTLQAIAKWDLSAKTYSKYNADVNVDSNVDLADVTTVLKVIAKWEGIVFGPKN